MKKIGLILCAVCMWFWVSGCGAVLEIPDNYVPISDAEAYEVTLQYDKVVRVGTVFTVIVTSKNVSGKDLYNETCSSLYRIGAKISVYTELGGQKFYLQDGFETLTDDVVVEKINKNETISYTWEFDGTLSSAIHGTETVNNEERRKIAPKGTYHILISTGERFDNAFEIL